MNPRIEKKLSKRLCEIAPDIFNNAWVDKEIMESAWDRKTSVSHVMTVGGFTDYFGEQSEYHTCWKWWVDGWVFHTECDGFSAITDDGKWNVDIPQFGTTPSTRYLLKLAKRANDYQKRLWS